MSVSASAVPQHTHAHVVGVYDRDDQLISSVSTFLIDALREGGSAVAIATPAHRRAFAAALTAEGYSVHDLELTGRYRPLDAHDTLATFMRNDRPDPDAFASTMGTIVETAATHDGPVQLFGEMVALLWNAGNVNGAIELESLWNDLAEHHAFALFCAYAMSSLEASGDVSAVRQMCDRHSKIERVFRAEPSAPRDVRRFVREVLRAWGDEQLLVDTELIASELATNAVKHARSPFRVSIARTLAQVTLSVRDASFDRPQSRVRAEQDFGGRGLGLVSELASAWGTQPETDGKTVWAELAR